jgi:hypothetical protein
MVTVNSGDGANTQARAVCVTPRLYPGGVMVTLVSRRAFAEERLPGSLKP